MKIRKLIALLSLLTVISWQAPTIIDDSKPTKLIVNLENAPFDSLFLHDYTRSRSILIPGIKTQEFTWEISIPDSIVSTYENMELLVSFYDKASNSQRTVRFINEKGDQKILVANVGVEDKINYIKGTYVGESSFPNENRSIVIDNKDSVIVRDLFSEDFKLILQDDQSDIAIRAQDPFFSWFMDFSNEGISYDDFLTSYTEISRKYPDSRFLMTSLASNLYQYKSKKDIHTIYSTLSNKHKDGKWSKEIERFLQLSSNKFENTALPTVDSNVDEDIVQNRSKHNLVIFSATWCAPCIEEIPLLKEIHKDLNKNLVFTYVSMDDEKTVASFHKLIQEKDIPWRTLFAYQDVEKIEQKYFAAIIPRNILVYPNGDMEVIDVRKDEDREKLYSLF